MEDVIITKVKMVTARKLKNNEQMVLIKTGQEKGLYIYI